MKTKIKSLGVFFLLLFMMTIVGCQSTQESEAITVEISGNTTETVAEESTNEEVPAIENVAEEEIEEDPIISVPENFTIDPNTGEYSFDAVDANVGYYFIRAFAVSEGVDAVTYAASSKRINGGTTGTMSGTIDVSTFGWGEYNIKLITYAAAGSGYIAPENVTLVVQTGVGGVMERPEFIVVTDGKDVELSVDWYTMADYYVYQNMPNIKWTIYNDEVLTEVVLEETVDLATVVETLDLHPTGGYIWGSTTNHDHLYINKQFAFVEGSYLFTFESAGTYYVTCEAQSKSESIADSQVATAVMFVLEDTERDGTFETYYSELWQEPAIFGIPIGIPGEYSDRIDFGATQETTAEIIQ